MVARDMRHMFAIESLRGDHYRDVSSWLGHSKISTTLDIYAANITGEDRVKSTPLTRPVAAQPTRDTVIHLPMDMRESS